MCVNPITLKVGMGAGKYKGYRVVHVPCNNCYECVRRRKLDWEIRLQYESYASDKVYFSLITYNDLYYHADIRYEELKLFLTLLRMRLKRKFGTTMKYFLVSEYGETRDRLHYHCLFFLNGWKGTNLEFKALLEQSWVKRELKHPDQFRQEMNEYRRLVYRLKKQGKDWKDAERPSKFLHIPIGFCSAQIPKGSGVGSISYCCKYIQKQYNKMYYSHLGFEYWINSEIDKGRLVYYPDEFSGALVAVPNNLKEYCFYKGEYPKVALRGKLVKVPKVWLQRAIGKFRTSYLSQITFLRNYDPTYDKDLDIQLQNKIARFNIEEHERVERQYTRFLLSRSEREVTRKWLQNSVDYSVNDFYDELRPENQFEYSRSNSVQTQLQEFFYCEDVLPLPGFG